MPPKLESWKGATFVGLSGFVYTGRRQLEGPDGIGPMPGAWGMVRLVEKV